jgi:hypothetical protein
MSWLIATFVVAFAATIAYWLGREEGMRWGRRDARQAEWDRLDDAARARAIADLNPVDPREVRTDDAA